MSECMVAIQPAHLSCLKPVAPSPADSPATLSFRQQIKCWSPSTRTPIPMKTPRDSVAAIPTALKCCLPAAASRHQTTLAITTILTAFVGSSVRQMATLSPFLSMNFPLNSISTWFAFSMAIPLIHLFCCLLPAINYRPASLLHPIQCWSFSLAIFIMFLKVSKRYTSLSPRQQRRRRRQQNCQQH